MKNLEEAEDDQGSEWLQVKKKQRSSSKYSLQNSVLQFKGKQSSEIITRQPPMIDRNSLPRKHRSYHRNAVIKAVTNYTPVKTKEEIYEDKLVVNHSDECSKPPSLRSENSTYSNSKIGDIVVLSQIDSDVLVHKSKCGDLEDGASLPTFENIAGDEPKENLFVETSLNSNVDSSEMPCFSCRDESFEEKTNDADELASNDFKSNRILKKCFSPSNSEVGAVVSEVDDLKFSASPFSFEGSNVIANSQESDLLPSIKSVSETTGLSTAKAFVGSGHMQNSTILDDSSKTRNVNDTAKAFVGSGHMQNSTILDDSSKTQNVNDSVEVNANESKGRFREHLWCFLFENLNRSVDELYLLCELECDLKQMKEVVLVLEEAASDFKDLSSRVEEFENMKGSSSERIEGISMTLMTDHPRPHALSWEVRRMTTSPHRAEILSSSLEAFKKIQQERESMRLAKDSETMGPDYPKNHDNMSSQVVKKLSRTRVVVSNSKNLTNKSGKPGCNSDLVNKSIIEEKGNNESIKCSKVMQNAPSTAPKNSSTSDSCSSISAFKDSSSDSVTLKNKKENNVGYNTSEAETLPLNKGELVFTGSKDAKNSTSVDHSIRQRFVSVEDKEMKNAITSRKSMNAWKEKRNWVEILSSRVSYSPAMNRRSAERARILHDKLMSPEKKKKTALHVKKEAEEKHAKAMRIRSELENERVQKLQRTSEKLNRVNDRQAVRSLKLREGLYARHQRSESRHEAFLAQVSRRAGDESSKVNEVRFITNLNEENRKLMLRQKHHDSELRRAEKLQVIKTKQKEDMAREEAVLERRKLIEAEKLQRLAEIQRKKEEAQVRWEEERKAASAAREAKAIEQLRRKQARAKAQREEALILAQKLAERISESEQRRKFYLEQIKDRASMDCRDQSSPLFWHSSNKENQGRSALLSNGEDYQPSNTLNLGNSTLATGNISAQLPLKRRIKRIRQRLMALKHDYSETSGVSENSSIGYRTALGIARAKIGRWLQELQRLRQARKEGAASIGLITSEIAKFVEGKEPELHSSREAGLLDFIASTLPASHTSKPESCQVTIHLLRLLKVLLSVPANRTYFLAQNLLPPIIPMLSGALENYIKIAASLHGSSTTNVLLNKSSHNFESIAEVLDGFLWTVTSIIGSTTYSEDQLHMQDGLLELVVLYQIIHRLRELFALYDRPQVEGLPFPSSILLSIKLLTVLTSRPGSVLSIDWESSLIKMEGESHIEETKGGGFNDFGNSITSNPCRCHKIPLSIPKSDAVPEERSFVCKDMNDEKAHCEYSAINSDNDNADFGMKIADAIVAPLEARKDENAARDIGGATIYDNGRLKHPMTLLLSAISETGLVCLLSLLTAVLLQANNKSSSEQVPSNFEEVATGVLKILNNLAVIDITLVQRMLARLDLKMEFFHLMSFLLSHCTTKWTTVTDQVGLLLVESLSLLGYFALFHPENQAVLRWGKSPTILHKVCDLPFAFFSDPQLMPVLGVALISACYGCDQNKGVIQQEISLDMLLSLLKSFPNNSPIQSRKTTINRPGRGNNHKNGAKRQQTLSMEEEDTSILILPQPFLLKVHHFFASNIGFVSS